MKKLKIYIFLAILVVPALFFCSFGCSKKQTMQISGTAFENATPIAFAVLKNGNQTLATTNENGVFSFSITSKPFTLTISHSNYQFINNSVHISKSESNVNFLGKEILPLNGNLQLSKLIVTPISYVPAYNIDGNFEIDAVKINFNNQTYATQNATAKLNVAKTIAFNQNIELETKQQSTLSFALDAKFKAGSSTSVYHEQTNQTIIVPNNLNTTHLTEQNQFLITQTNINSSNKLFTYKICFVFDYYTTNI